MWLRRRGRCHFPGLCLSGLSALCIYLHHSLVTSQMLRINANDGVRCFTIQQQTAGSCFIRRAGKIMARGAPHYAGALSADKKAGIILLLLNAYLYIVLVMAWLLGGAYVVEVTRWMMVRLRQLNTLSTNCIMVFHPLVLELYSTECSSNTSVSLLTSLLCITYLLLLFCLTGCLCSYTPPDDCTGLLPFGGD